MRSPEGPYNQHEPGNQYDFFNILDDVVPNEDLKKFSIGKNREFVFDPKERDSFLIFDYISQTTCDVRFDAGGNILDLSVRRMGGEAGEVETTWKRQHRALAEEIISEHTELFGITKH
jgi:hypothetical protein